MFGLFGKREKKEELTALEVSDESIVAMADGELLDIAKVKDPMFAEKMMGETTAFAYEGDSVTVCAPANGTLSVLFPTGHAFGITMNNGVELLVHIGIDTVNSKGDGFRTLKKQGDAVKAGEPVVTVDLKKLRKSYDMSTMLVVTDQADHAIAFKDPCTVKRGDSVIK